VLGLASLSPYSTGGLLRHEESITARMLEDWILLPFDK